ncbi:ribosome-associated translation inhibitor RaiA [Saxibacter everestensis]|uniref:Ribosome hibernation promoting factor n=1 Tax=Saxibacter everestensis TaxID=2909229 RepID=A0ABY8QR23_9MICO|nr:ribosome-associated translation inhibitor RaiA [Brevibacteriaceae bacterium ZFBP1038]
MDIVVTGRNLAVPDRFRDHLNEKLAKVEQMAPRAQRIDVHVTHEKNPRQSDSSERVELTVWAKGPVIRAEAAASDKYAALDLSFGKLMERLRRSRDRKKVHRGRRRPQSVAEVVAELPPEAAIQEAPASETPAPAPPTPSTHVVKDTADGHHRPVDAEGDCPVLVREKVFPGQPISLDDALARMELVGHDFYLFVDSETSQPSVVYRRRGWSYGVITLDSDLEGHDEDDAPYAEQVG